MEEQEPRSIVAEEAENLIDGDKREFDGYLVYMTSLWTKIGEVFARRAYPVADSPVPPSSHSVIMLWSQPAYPLAGRTALTATKEPNPYPSLGSSTEALAPGS
jgi:hypothetical protein